MCVLIAISLVPYTFWRKECWWFFQLNGNSCYRVMCLMKVERVVCFYLLWPQPWYGNTWNEQGLPSDARPSGGTFFGLMKQDVACYPGHLVSMGKTQFMLGTTGPTAGILQVSTFQMEDLWSTLGGKRKQSRSASMCLQCGTLTLSTDKRVAHISNTVFFWIKKCGPHWGYLRKICSIIRHVVNANF